jgi:hypothetical protein
LNNNKLLLVGDNPFHGISHLSDERARKRGEQISHADYAAGLILTSLDNGADGFMFSVSEGTLAALEIVSEKAKKQSVALHAIVPYAYEYVRLATSLGTVGLGKKLASQVLISGNLQAIASGLKGSITMDPKALMKTYLLYEVNRIMRSIGSRQKLDSLLLHEVITDMALALNLDWFFNSYIRFVSKLKIKPGFETRNFPYLINKFKEWNIDFSRIELVSSFNKAGFQMNPSKTKCEEMLAALTECHVIAMSILAAGYLRLPEAVDYISSLPNVSGLVIGVSRERHALETFEFVKETLKKAHNKSDLYNGI